MPDYTEDAITAALNAVQTGQSLRSAAKDYSIPLTTLYRRKHGSEDTRTAHEHQQRLSNSQEKVLVDWALIQGDIGLPPTHAQLRYIVQRILQAAGDHKPLGKHWIHISYHGTLP